MTSNDELPGYSRIRNTKTTTDKSEEDAVVHDLKNISKLMNINLVKLGLLTVCVFAAATHAVAQEHGQEHQARAAQIVALDECDPTTFNAVLGPDFCRNVTIGAFTTFNDLFAKAAAGTPDPGWDFEPDEVKIKEGADLSVVDQGGEPHTFTEVKQFGGGFIPGLNAPGENTVPECSGGFANVAVARTRILQASTVQVTGLSKGKHLFQCCIHPWMRVTVDVK